MVDAEGVKHVGVEPVRDFPLSDPHQWISVCDVQGHELVCIQDVNELSDKVRQVLLSDLSRREFVPVIERIEHVSSDTDPTQWTVKTDRGLTTFLVKGDDDVRRLEGERALIVDAAGIRYLVPDAGALDANSRRYLDRFL